MHDLIYARNQALEPALLRRLAASIGLDLERLDAELAADTHLRHIMEDFQSGVESASTARRRSSSTRNGSTWDFEIATPERASVAG